MIRQPKPGHFREPIAGWSCRQLLFRPPIQVTLVDGGQGPHYVLVLYMNGWADLADPDPPFDTMLEKAMGKHDAQALMHSVDDAVQKEWTELCASALT